MKSGELGERIKRGRFGYAEEKARYFVPANYQKGINISHPTPMPSLVL